MSLPVKIDFDVLRDFDSALYSKLSTLFKLQHGYHLLDLNLTRWSDRNFIVQFLDYQKTMKAEEERRDAARHRMADADTEAYKARLLQYVREQDLEPTAENAEIIRKWLDEHPQIKGYKSSQNADAAISLLRKTLTWKPKVSAAPPTPPPPPAVILSDGSEQLPLDAAPTYKHTKAQLTDLAKRQLAAAKKDRGGWHGTSL